MAAGVQNREATYVEPDAMAAPSGRDLPQPATLQAFPRKGAEPVNPAECPPQPVRFARREVTLPGGATPNGFEVVSLNAQEGLVYPGLFVRWGCPYTWLIREGVITVRLVINEKMAYPLAERQQQPRDPILIPQCWKAGDRLSLVASWTDATVTTFTAIPFWGEMALGSDWPPVYDDANENRVRRRTATLVPVVVLPGGAFASVSPAVIRPTAGKIWAQVSPGTVATQRPEFTFATLRGGGAGNAAGHLHSVAPNFYPVEIECDDMRDFFLGAPTAGAVTAPTTVMLHREVW